MTDDITALRSALAAVTGHPEATPGQWSISPAMHLAELDPVDVDWIATASPDRISRLLDRLEAAEMDAERYRWLREQPHDLWGRIAWNTWNNDPGVWPGRDAAIDAAMQGE